MKNMKAKRSKVGRVLILGLGLILAPSVAWAGELPKFTGYTRPGVPTGSPGPIQAAGDKEAAPIGVTVYFKVYQRSGDEEDGDPWGTGFTDLDRFFIPGEASRGRNAEKLDTTARYLYLYQVINDSYRPAQVKSVAVRLLVPPHLITSWGHFAEKRRKEAGRGVGFAMLFENPDPKNPKAKSRVLPLSTDHPGVQDDVYRDPAPYFYPPKPYTLSGMPLNNKPAPLTDGEDTGREPERVVLQSTFNFEGAPNWLVKDRVRLPLSPNVRLALPYSGLDNPYYNPGSPLMPSGFGALGMAPGMPGMAATTARPVDVLHRAPAIVAYWNDEPLRPGVAGTQPGQRSVIFGFTSNFPPVYEDVRVRGTPTGPFKVVAEPAADPSSTSPRVDGEVPTPVALEQGIPPLGHALGNFGGPIGEIGGGGGLLRGGGFGGGGFGFGFPFGGGGFGGGGGGFGGGGGGFGGGGSGGGSGTSSNTGTGTSTGTSSGTSQGVGTSALSPALASTLLSLLTNRLALSNQLLNGLALNNNLSTGNLGGQTVNVNVNVSQSQSLSQSQSQSQSQAQAQAQAQAQGQVQGHGHGHHGHVVPEPAAMISGLLGVPFLLLVIRRHKRMPVAVP